MAIAAPLTVGFSQVGSESGWRAAETSVAKEEAAKRGITLKIADGQQKQENQIKAVRSFIAQGSTRSSLRRWWPPAGNRC
jgi:simple sugar transport system substrate-binding protein